MIPFLYRHALQKANNKLVKILLEVAKTTAAAEETIGCHVLGILDRSSKGQPAASLLWRSEADLSAKPGVQDASGRGNVSYTVEKSTSSTEAQFKALLVYRNV